MGSITDPDFAGSSGAPNQQDGVAVVGMACKFPGADSLEQFWDILETGRSMVGMPPNDRFTGQAHSRTSNKSVFFGNYLENVSSFDNQFFKKSSREAASMDPQQRLLLEVAYQALESAGYFGLSQNEELGRKKDVGVFVGACASDYNDNVASHPPNAYSSLGTLRAFLSGRISHAFGFSGPSTTFDTACSSSAVAIDAACKAVKYGDCSLALAGGVSVFTSPFFFQNLAAASFLSPTGATKSFDAAGDGYCRGEGVGLVVLKPFSQALADGDTILGTILSTAVRQSSNEVPITVPHSLSQAALYQKVLGTASITAKEVSYLEAHGTGTPVGDVQEFDSIQRTFENDDRRAPLRFASVKGNIGHTEGASGVAGLIKVLLMMRKAIIPQQANYVRPNSKMNFQSGKLAIPTETIPWESSCRIALVNNYGAAGSMAAMVVKEGPRTLSYGDQGVIALQRYPFLVSANSEVSLASNCQQLRGLTSNSESSSRNGFLADIAFNLHKTQNIALPNLFAFTAASVSDLDQQLERFVSDPSCHETITNPKPVVLVFGGQTARCASISKEVYDSSSLFRGYLDECDSVLRRLGYSSIYPGIFFADPFDDIVAQQARQFAVQYASAQTWMMCGLKVNCVLGHSFGQLVALSVSGILSLDDGLRLACGRGALMRDRWGPERGSMIALDADLATTHKLMSDVAKRDPSCKIEVACYNGPKSHVLVGSAAETKSLAEAARDLSIRHKIMDMTHGFHSRFCDPIISGLEEVASGLTYHEPKIPIETCSHQHNWPQATPKLIADHTRSPVYFEEAVSRIVSRNGACTWLEAGSNSSIINITRRVFTNAGGADHLLLPSNLMQQDAMGTLADLTTTLWKHGHYVQFWPFHHSQSEHYSSLYLPPYQFEKRRHWLDFKLDSEIFVEKKPEATPEGPEPDPVLLNFSGFGDSGKRQATFTIDPRSREWQVLVKGHSVLGEPLCPAPLYLELVMQASKDISSRLDMDSTALPHINFLEIAKPLGASQSNIITLTLKRREPNSSHFDFEFSSQKGENRELEKFYVHATGSVEVVSSHNSKQIAGDFDRLGKLVGYQKLDEIGAEPESEVAQGSVIYKVFSRVVQYHDFYKGVREIASSNGRAVARVQLPASEPEAVRGLISNPLAIDNFFQVSGLQSNCLGPCPPDEVFVCTLIDSVKFAPDYADTCRGLLEIFSMSTATADKECSNDIFVRNKDTGKLIFVAFGAVFSRVRTTSLAKAIARANKSEDRPLSSQVQHPLSPETHIQKPVPQNLDIPRGGAGIEMSSSSEPRLNMNSVPNDIALETKNELFELETQLQSVLSGITDIPSHEFKGAATLDDLGVDSLMATEIISEIQQAFNISIPQDHFQHLSTFSALRDYLATNSAASSSSISNSTTTSSSASSTPVSSSDATEIEVGSHLDISSLDQSKDWVRRLGSLLEQHLECSAATFERPTVLAECGLDSLLCMELMSDIEKLFGVSVDLSVLTTDSTFGELADILLDAVTGDQQEQVEGRSSRADESSNMDSAPDDFEDIKDQFDSLAEKCGFSGFYRSVYPDQARLVLSYTVDAFADLGHDLTRLNTGEEITPPNVLPKHQHLRKALLEVLRDGEVANYDGKRYFRSEKAIDTTTSSELFEHITKAYPKHAKEHGLLKLCGSQLSKVLIGEKDPLSVLFGSKASRNLLEDVYTSSPMYMVMSQLLSSFLDNTLRKASPGSGGKIRILEVGAGTGATTRWVVERLVQSRIPIEYTFTDCSSSLVAAGKRKFSQFDCMRYATLDVEEEPPAEFQGKFDIVLSTNCIHATSNLSNSMSNINKLLSPHGFVSLVEFTKRFYWFDIVFGMLDGWWLFNDGRPYVLVPPEHWERSVRSGGFKHVSWTGGSTPESEAVRIITGFKQSPADSKLCTSIPQERRSRVETLVFDHADKGLPLKADIYRPSPAQASSHNSWTAALMIHGGGHVMLSRKDIRPRQTKLLLDNGFLPVSIDYRLCPETTILEGPMTDVGTAYAWVLRTLPSLDMVNLVQGKAVVVGWSTGGTLAMSLGWTSIPRGLPPPAAILAFYCPTDYEDDFWQSPNIPDHTSGHMDDAYNVLDGVFPAPISSYNVDPKLKASGGWMAPQDPRSRLVLHMNWKGQTLPFLFGGLDSSIAKDTSPDSATSLHLAQPTKEEITKASPYAQIVKGAYKSPTHIIFGTMDDLIPWEQAQRTAGALKDAGVESGLTLVQDEPHLFDINPDKDGKRWNAVLEGYRFLFSRA